MKISLVAFKRLAFAVDAEHPEQMVIPLVEEWVKRADDLHDVRAMNLKNIEFAEYAFSKLFTAYHEYMIADAHGKIHALADIGFHLTATSYAVSQQTEYPKHPYSEPLNHICVAIEEALTKDFPGFPPVSIYALAVGKYAVQLTFEEESRPHVDALLTDMFREILIERGGDIEI